MNDYSKKDLVTLSEEEQREHDAMIHDMNQQYAASITDEELAEQKALQEEALGGLTIRLSKEGQTKLKLRF
jgi:hypothetical protein